MQIGFPCEALHRRDTGPSEGGAWKEEEHLRGGRTRLAWGSVIAPLQRSWAEEGSSHLAEDALLLPPDRREETTISPTCSLHVPSGGFGAVTAMI